MALALDAVTFDDGFVRALPGDAGGAPGSRQVRGACYSLVAPTPVSAPRIAAWSDEAAALLGIERPATDDGVVAEILGGNRVIAGMRPFAACYGGHQFGVWAGQLGDGRAISLTELVGPDGQRWEVQLKGAGPTPYSRTADGRAVLRSSVREFLCSEAMHHLGVPTTRALCLVTTGEQVMRDMFYDGRSRAEPGAIVTRLAPTFVRFGSFELPSIRGDHALLRALADHVIAVHYPELGEPSTSATYVRWFVEICRRTAVMIAHWMRIGFVHGVMNTDNMSILGLTLDYGPYGWLDTYSRDFTPNTTDAANGRYRFGHQPGIARWNLAHFARALVPLVDDPEALAAGLEVYRETFETTYEAMMAAKLGLTAIEDDDDRALLSELLAILEAEETDPTILFRRLADVPIAGAAGADSIAMLEPAFYGTAVPAAHRARLVAWHGRYAARARRDPGAGDRRSRMNAANPVVILRNYLVQEAIELAERGDLSRVTELLDAARRPYEDRPEHARLLARRPDWARNAPGCSALSCSS